MRQNRAIKEALSSFIATVFPTDTLLRALKVMDLHQVRLLGVVGEGGGLMGLVSEEHVLNAWKKDPLASVSTVMARVGEPREGAVRRAWTRWWRRKGRRWGAVRPLEA